MSLIPTRRFYASMSSGQNDWRVAGMRAFAGYGSAGRGSGRPTFGGPKMTEKYLPLVCDAINKNPHKPAYPQNVLPPDFGASVSRGFRVSGRKAAMTNQLEIM